MPCRVGACRANHSAVATVCHASLPSGRRRRADDCVLQRQRGAWRPRQSHPAPAGTSGAASWRRARLATRPCLLDGRHPTRLWQGTSRGLPAATARRWRRIARLYLPCPACQRQRRRLPSLDCSLPTLRGFLDHLYRGQGLPRWRRRRGRPETLAARERRLCRRSVRPHKPSATTVFHRTNPRAGRSLLRRARAMRGRQASETRVAASISSSKVLRTGSRARAGVGSGRFRNTAANAPNALPVNGLKIASPRTASR